MEPPKLDRKVCDYCRRLNPAELGECAACGAPLPERVIPAPGAPRPLPARPTPTDDVADKAVGGLKRAHEIYTNIFLGSLIFLFLGFVLGQLGYLAGQTAWGIGGALLLGAIMGLVDSPFQKESGILPTTGSCMGALAGLLLGIPFWAFGRPAGMLCSGVGLALFFGLVIARSKKVERGKWEWARALLGILAGMGFTGLGCGLGVLVAWLLRLVLG